MKKKLEENCIFLFFGKFLEHWKQKWWKMIKTWKKNEKKWKKNEKNWGKIAIFHFLENCNFPRVCFSFFFIFLSFFYHFSSFFINSTTGSKNDKKMIKKWKKLEENCIFLFFGKFLEHWKQKWWKMIKNEKKMKKMKKTEGKLQFFIFWKIAIFLEFVFHFFSFFFHFFFIFFSFFIIFHHFSSIPPLEAKMIKKW